MTLAIHVHVVRGKKDGPKLLLVSTIHGKEWSSVEVVRRVITSLQPESLSGTQVAIPIANPLAYQSETNNTPLPWEAGNLNRSFPGDPLGSINEKIAYVITKEVLGKVDSIISLHSNDSNRTAQRAPLLKLGQANQLESLWNW
jgi:hypothetical protein